MSLQPADAMLFEKSGKECDFHDAEARQNDHDSEPWRICWYTCSSLFNSKLFHGVDLITEY